MALTEQAYNEIDQLFFKMVNWEGLEQSVAIKVSETLCSHCPEKICLLPCQTAYQLLRNTFTAELIRKVGLN